LRHDLGPPDAAISFAVLYPVVAPSVIKFSGELIARIFAVNRAGPIAGTFLVNLLTL
jgi:hypothetical protein